MCAPRIHRSPLQFYMATNHVTGKWTSVGLLACVTLFMRAKSLTREKLSFLDLLLFDIQSQRLRPRL